MAPWLPHKAMLKCNLASSIKKKKKVLQLVNRVCLILRNTAHVHCFDRCIGSWLLSHWTVWLCFKQSSEICIFSFPRFVFTLHYCKVGQRCGGNTAICKGTRSGFHSDTQSFDRQQISRLFILVVWSLSVHTANKLLRGSNETKLKPSDLTWSVHICGTPSPLYWNISTCEKTTRLQSSSKHAILFLPELQ